MFFLYIFLGIFLISLIFILFSSIELRIENVKFLAKNLSGRHLNKEYKIVVIIKLFNKINLLKLNITKTKLERKNLKIDLEKIKKKAKDSEVNFDIKFIKILKNLKIDLEYINLRIDIGTEDAALTAISTGVISSIIAIMLKNSIGKNKKNLYKVIPIYQNKNLLKIELDCIFKVKLIHIIYTIYILRKKGEENVRTSNRRSYAYSNE